MRVQTATVNVMEYPASDARHPSLVDETGEVPGSMTQPLREVRLWCSPEPSHWISTFIFEGAVRKQLQEYGGVSFNMSQPDEHELKDTDLRLLPPTNLGSPSIKNRGSRHNYIGSLHVSARPNNALISRNPLLTFTYPILPQTEVTGHDILLVILEKFRHQYRFHNQECGCLHWQIELLAMLSHRGWLGPDIRDGVCAVIEDARKTDRVVKRAVTWDRHGPRAGAFYRLWVPEQIELPDSPKTGEDQELEEQLARDID